MNIRNIRELKAFAAQRLMYSQSERRIVWIFATLTLGLSAAVTAVNYILDMQISNFGGLSNLGTRTLLSSIQSMLPLVLSMVILCIEVGYLAAMLRVARGQYTSPQTLRLGFDRFWVLLRCSLVKGLYYLCICTISVYLGVMIYMISPLSNEAVEFLIPIVSEVSVLDSSFILDEAVSAQLATLIAPAYVISGIVLLLLISPVMYSFRMANYVIIDKPAMGALAALRESKKMMRGNRLALLKLDLSLWWYYATAGVISLIGYGDVILPMLGISLPWPVGVSYFLFFALSLGLMFALYYFLRNRLEVTYALAYDAVKPPEPKSNGVVLGNIFQM